MFWLICLLAIRISYPWLPLLEWKSLLLDIGVGTSLLYLFRSNQIPRAVEAWYFLKFRRHDKMKRQLNLALASDTLRLISLPFAIMWAWHWWDGWDAIFSVAPTKRALTYIDVYIFCLFLAYLLDTHRFRHLLLKAQMTSGRQILIQYAIAVLLGTILLLLPISLKDGQALSLIDAFFELGLMGIEIPTELGGAGASFFMAILAVEELSRVDASAGLSGAAGGPLAVA